MSYFTQLANLMIEVMLPVGLLVAVGGLWPRFFPDTPVESARLLLNRMMTIPWGTLTPRPKSCRRRW